MKKSVEIEIHSTSDAQTVVQKAAGEVYVKPDAVYLKYKEPSYDMGQTSTTLKIRPDTIKVIRHGDVQSEQEFSLNKRVLGFYYLPQGRTGLETFTHSMSVQLVEGIGVVTWSYDLSMMGDAQGSYDLRVDIRDSDAG
jgi:uncharacterized beta-barrel protein YwiB (DUF1934 family)